MAEEFLEIRQNITLFLSSLRRSIDYPIRRKLLKSGGERERFMQTIMLVEEARVRFSTYTRNREEPTSTVWPEVRNELMSFLNVFMDSDNVDTSVYDKRFIIMSRMSRDGESSTDFVQMFRDRENPITISEALVLFRSYLVTSEIEQSNSQDALKFGDLERIVPRQQVAPVQFDIVESRIVVSELEPKTDEADRNNIQSALDHICDSGDNLIKNLENSNCDRRLLENVKDLHSQLTSNGNIVKIGLTNMSCSEMGAQFRNELPDAIFGMLNAYNSSISLYVAQFPDWDQFTQKAAAIALDEDDVEEVYRVVGDIIEKLTNNPDLADPEVPKTIKFIRDFLDSPGNSSKRAAFAMIRTIENLVSSVVRYSIDFFSKTAEKVVDAGSTAAANIIVSLLSIALIGASGVGPAALHAGAPWVSQAAEVVQKQIEKLAK